MAKRFLLDPEGVRHYLLNRYRRQCRQWLTGSGEWPMRLSLGVPTERQATEQLTEVRIWQERWADWHRKDTRVEWTNRRWSILGTQRLPEALTIDSVEAIATLIGKDDEWAQVSHRYQEVITQWPVLSDALPNYYDLLAEWRDVEFERLLHTIKWLESNPYSGIYIRQLPISGIDSKWLEGRQTVIYDWLQHILCESHDGDLYSLTGLQRLPTLLRFRLLDPALRTKMGGIGDIHARVSELASLQLQIEKVFIVENLQTGLAFDDIPGAMVFMKQGYAVDLFGELPWLKGLVCHYWGDLDTHGFAILDRLRHYLPQTTSLLMDSETLQCHRELWGREEKPATAELEWLTPAEKALYDGLRRNHWGDRIRLEQERIDWNYAQEKILSSV